MIKRVLNLNKLVEKKSAFLLGPRSTGKTFLINQEMSKDCVKIDLLKSFFFLPLSQNPSSLGQYIPEKYHLPIVIDEIQKLPILLNEVQALIEAHGYRFLLTGSSARKLKAQQANLLGGRASPASLFGLTWHELSQAKKFSLEKMLRYGSLPRVYLSDNPQTELYDYIDIYIEQEIKAEALVRHLPEFSRFLNLVSLYNGEIINFSNIASDVGLSANSIREYFQILEDTLIGKRLEPWRKKTSRKAIQSAKFYLFDLGVVHTLANNKILDRNSNLYGMSFETFIINEVKAYLSYRRIREELFFWRTYDGVEVDLIVGNALAIEIKATTKADERSTKNLKVIAEEKKWQGLYLVTQDINSKYFEKNIQAIHWEKFLQKLWADELLK